MKNRNNCKWTRTMQFALLSLFVLAVSINGAYAENFTNSTDSDSDGYNYTVDCDDNNSNVWLNLSGFADMDADNYTSGGSTILCTNETLPSGYVSVQNPEDCDDTNYSINPGTDELLYNGADDDCSASTSDEIQFDITTTKDTYNIGEAASFTVDATNHSDVNITLNVPGDYFNYQAQFMNQTYPITDTSPYTKKVGGYIIIGAISYQGYTLYLNKTFSVRNSIEVTIDGETGIDDGEVLELEAEARGGYGDNYEFSWNFGDGNTGTGSSVTHEYSSPDDYTIKLSVKDEEDNEKNETIEIKVYKQYGLKIVTIDKSTESAIKDVSIDIDDASLKTGNDGSAVFEGKRGSYDITAYKSGYRLYEANGYELKKNSTLTLRLTKIDEESPVITLENKEVVSKEGIAQISFVVEDSTLVDCSIYTSSDGDWWNLIETIEGIETSTTQTVDVTNIEEEPLKYKIECVDSESNTALSEEGTIEKEIDTGKFEEINILKEGLQSAKNTLESLTGKEKEAFVLLELDIALKEAQRRASNFNSDLDSIQNPMCPGLHCDITGEEKQKRIDELIEKTKASIEKVPKNIVVTNLEEFVKYPTMPEIESTIKSFFEAKKIALTKKQLKNLIETTTLLQSKLTVSTKAYSTEIEFINGEKKQITVIKKELEIYDKEGNIKNNKNYVILEDIKEASTNDIDAIFVSDTETLIDENLYSISTEEDSIIYYMEKELGNEAIKSTRTILLNPQLTGSSGVTGFAFAGFGTLKNINYLYLIIAIVVIALTLRLGIMFGLFERFRILQSFSLSRLFGRFDQKEYHAMMMLVNDVQDYMDTGDMQKASLIYKEIKLKYEELSKTSRLKVYDKIIELSKKIDEHYMKSLVEKARDDISKGNRPHGIKIYSKIEAIYKKLTVKSKSLFEKDLLDIHKSISQESK